MTSFDSATARLLTMHLVEVIARQLARHAGRPEGEWERFARRARMIFALRVKP